MLLAFAKPGVVEKNITDHLTRLAKQAHKEATIIVIGGGPAGSATTFLDWAAFNRRLSNENLFPVFTPANPLIGECCAGLRTLDMEPEIRRQKHPIKHGVKVFSPHRRAVFVKVREGCPETNALIPTSSGQSYGAL